MKKIVFLVRDDFFLVFGGDRHQVEQYIKYSENLSFDIKTTQDIDFSISYDLYIIVNIDRSYEYVWFYNEIIKNNCLDRFLILPIHHSLGAMNLFNRKRIGKLWTVLSWLGGYYFIEKLKGVFRLVRSKRFSCISSVLFKSFKGEIKKSILNSKAIILISEGEGRDLMHDFHVDDVMNKSFIVRNGCPLNVNIQAKAISERNIDILICGRIEQRKNQVAIARSLSGLDCKAVFVGSENKSNPEYFKEFLSVVSSSDNCDYIGSLDNEELMGLYENSKISLNASWFEVSSLVDIEAYSNGCYIFTSVYGNSNEIIDSNRISLVDPEEMEVLSDDIMCVLEKIKNKKYISKDLQSWKDSSIYFSKKILELTNDF